MIKEVKRKAVNFSTCYLRVLWKRTNIECLNCDLWSICATKQSNIEEIEKIKKVVKIDDKK